MEKYLQDIIYELLRHQVNYEKISAVVKVYCLLISFYCKLKTAESDIKFKTCKKDTTPINCDYLYRKSLVSIFARLFSTFMRLKVVNSSPKRVLQISTCARLVIKIGLRIFICLYQGTIPIIGSTKLLIRYFLPCFH